MRLHRSLVKRGLLAEVGIRGCARFFASYTAGDRELRSALLRRLPRERARLAIHALGWRLESPDPIRHRGLRGRRRGVGGGEIKRSRRQARSSTHEASSARDREKRTASHSP